MNPITTDTFTIAHLFDAVSRNDIDTIHTILNFIDINSKDKKGKTPLLHALEYESPTSEETIQTLLEYDNIDVNCGYESESPLSSLIEQAGITNKDKLKFAKILLNKGANPNGVPSEENKLELPLNDAIETNHMELVKLLLENGADPNIPAKSGPQYEAEPGELVERTPVRTPLYTAFLERNFSAIQMLLDYGADPSDTTFHYEQNFLNIAIIFNNTKLINLLLEKGLDVNYKTPKRKTPVLTALQYRDDAVMRVLLPYKPKIDIVNPNGNKAQHTMTKSCVSDANKGKLLSLSAPFLNTWFLERHQSKILCDKKIPPEIDLRILYFLVSATVPLIGLDNVFKYFDSYAFTREDTRKGTLSLKV